MAELTRTIKERWGVRHTNGQVAQCSREYAIDVHKRFGLPIMHTVNGFWEDAQENEPA